MLELATLARPYARAAFDAGREEGALEEWNQRLRLASAIITDAGAQRLARDPRLTRDELLSLFADVGGDSFTTGFLNYLRVLAVYRRLELLPEITAQFERLRQAAEERLAVQVTAASEMSDDQRKTLAESLTRRFGRKVELEIHVDPAVIGGAIIHAGDQVIDGSIRGRLDRLSRTLAH